MLVDSNDTAFWLFLYLIFALIYTKKLQWEPVRWIHEYIC